MEPKANEFEMLLDGTLARLKTRLGKMVSTTIRKIPIKDMERFVYSFGNFPEEVALYLNRPLAFVHRLSDDSFEAAFKEGRRLNFI